MSQERVYVMYRLKDGVEMDDYIRWSQEVDQKTVPGLAAINNFAVRRVISTIEGPDRAFDVIEEIDVTSVEDWKAANVSEAMAQIQEEWPQYADASSAVIVAAVPIPPQ